MKKIEFILLAGFLFGLTLMSFLIDIGFSIVGFSLSFLSVFYFICSVPFFLGVPFKKYFTKSAYTGISILRIVGTVGVAYGLSIAPIGLMFKLLLLPGASLMLGIGIGVQAIMLIIVMSKFIESGDKEFYKRLLIRLIPFLAIGFFFHKTPTNKQVGFFYRDQPEFVELYNRYYEDPTNEELAMEVEDAIYEMGEGNDREREE